MKSRAFDGLMSPGCWSLLTDFGIDLKPRAGGREIRRREGEGIMDPTPHAILDGRSEPLASGS